MTREEYVRLLERTTAAPTDPGEVREALQRQVLYHPSPTAAGLEELAGILSDVLANRLDGAEAELGRLAARYPEQPLACYYLFALQYHVGDTDAARRTLRSLAGLDRTDPLIEMFQLHLDREPIPGISEEIRLENIRKLASIPMLSNPYRIAVGAIFENIRNREHARVLDVGVGSGAQMVELLGLLRTQPHKIRQIDLLGLDFVEGFLARAEQNITAAARELAGRVDVSFWPVHGHVEDPKAPWQGAILGRGALDAVNATITLHEVPGEAKALALENLRGLNPARLIVTEWNFVLENTLPETSVAFLFNVRQVAAAWVAALRRRYSVSEARQVVGDILRQAGGQVTCPANERQECYLNAVSWKTLLEWSGFALRQPDQRLLAYASEPSATGPGRGGWHLAAYVDAGTHPLVLLEASPTAPGRG